MKKIFIILAVIFSEIVFSQTIYPVQVKMFKKTIDSTTFKTLGSIPITLYGVSGLNTRIAIIPGTADIRRSGGTSSGYTFSAPILISLSINGVDVAEWPTVTNNFLSSNTNQPADLIQESYAGINQEAQVLILSTSTGDDPISGNNSITITFLYYITNTN